MLRNPCPPQSSVGVTWGNSTGNVPSHSWFSPRGALGEWLGHGSVQQRSYDRAGCD